MLPGGYSFLDQLELTDEQKEKLGTIAEDYSKKQAEVRREAMKEFADLLKEGRKDREKREKFRVEVEGFMKEKGVTPPVDEVAAVLKPQQLDALTKAHAAATEWNHWLESELVEYEKSLADALGKTEKTRSRGLSTVFARLETQLPGARFIPRVAVDEDLYKELYELARRGLYRHDARRRRAEYLLRSGQKLPGEYRGVLRDSMQGVKASERNRRLAQALQDLVPKDLRERLAKADAIADERDAAIRKQLSKAITAISTALPDKAPAVQAAPTWPALETPKAAAVVTDWNKWLQTELPKYDKQLDQVVGDEPFATDSRVRGLLSRLSSSVPAAELLARLDLTDEQVAELEQRTSYQAFTRDTTERRRLAQTPAARKFPLLLRGIGKSADRSAIVREAIRDVLTPKQRGAFESGEKVLAARSEALATKYDATIDALAEALPEEPKREKPDGKPVFDRKLGPPERLRRR
jgi:hypothetical protein